MAEDWNFYLCNVNNVLASVFLDLGLREVVPDRGKPTLLWVWVYLRWPREDGLSASSEFDALKAIEEKLTETMVERFDAALCGRITTDGRREFYYYAPRSERLEAAVEDAMSQFRDYEFDCGSKADPEWRQYLDVLYPSDEDRQRIENRKVLEVLEQKKDTLKTPRDVWHWIYFRTETDREEFWDAVSPLEYRVQSQSQSDRSDFPFGLCIVRFQSVNSTELDNAVIEMFRLAKKHRGDYDGWETQAISQ
jgi:regulator of RNase E activity RraB